MTYLISDVLTRLVSLDLGLLRLVLANDRHNRCPFADTSVIGLDTLMAFQLGVLEGNNISRHDVRSPLGDRRTCLDVDQVSK